MKPTKTLLLCTLALFSVMVSSPAQAQQKLKDLTKPKNAKMARQFKKLSFQPGKVDASINVGAGLSLYPQIGVALEVGVMNLTQDVTLSVGAELNYAYCVGCFIFNGIASYAGGNTELSSSAIIPGGRLALHLPIISKIAQLPQFDPFVGAYVAPSITTSELKTGSFHAKLTTLTLTAGALAGARWMLNDSLFFSGEVRYLATWSPPPFERTFQGVPVTLDYGAFARNSGELNLGVGARF